MADGTAIAGLTGAGMALAEVAPAGGVGVLAGFTPCVDNVWAQAVSNRSSPVVNPLKTNRSMRVAQQEL